VIQDVRGKYGSGTYVMNRSLVRSVAGPNESYIALPVVQ
jgi:hypothetical protein